MIPKSVKLFSDKITLTKAARPYSLLRLWLWPESNERVLNAGGEFA